MEVQNAFSWITAAYIVGFVLLGGTSAYLVWERRRLRRLQEVTELHQ